MARPVFRSTFEAGEISPDWLRRIDTPILASACQTARNVILKASGGILRRPGTTGLSDLQGQARHYRFEGRGFTEILVLTNGRLDVYDESGSLQDSITSSVPWTTAQLARLKFTADANRVYVFHQEFVTQVLERASDGSWSRADFSFLSGINSNPAQPFYDKFSDIDVTMSVNAYSGTGRTLTFSDDVLKTDGSHVGVRFRYLGACEMTITAVASATSATVTINDALYPTLDVTVASSAGYKVGQVVEGSISQVRGIVASIQSGTVVRVTLLEGYDQFQVITESGVDKDRLVGPESRGEITGVSTVATPATTSIWDEQLTSDARGYPATGVVHRGRLFMTGFPEATDVVVASAVGNFHNFALGTDDDSAINTELGDDPNSEIRHLVSAEQLLLFTDRGAYYVPESAESPITPESLAFLRLGQEGASYVEPVVASEGVLYIDAESGRLMAAVPTGNVRRSWQPIELSEYAYHLLTGPVRIAVSNGLDGRSERYVFVLNADGTLAVMIYRRGAEIVGWTAWERGEGTWTDIGATADTLTCVSKIDTTYRLGAFSFGALVDDEIDYSSSVSGRNGDTAAAVKNKVVVVEETVASGEVPSVAPASGYTLGYDFAVTLRPAPPVSENGWRRQRIARTTLEVVDSGAVTVNGKLSWPYGAGDDLENTGAVSSRVIRAFKLGWANDQTPLIQQSKGEGALLDVLACSMEVV